MSRAALFLAAAAVLAGIAALVVTGSPETRGAGASAPPAELQPVDPPGALGPYHVAAQLPTHVLEPEVHSIHSRHGVHAGIMAL